MQKEYILFGTSGCHLCEDAEAVISNVIQTQDINYIKQDIVEDENLLHQYALSIPVFKCLTTERELFWPFTVETIEAFIRQ